MTHRFHPDPARNDPKDAILWDDCADCERHAAYPFVGLDNNNLRRAFRLMFRAETGEGEGRRAYLTWNESELCKRMYKAYLTFSRLSLFDLSHVHDVLHGEESHATTDESNR